MEEKSLFLCKKIMRGYGGSLTMSFGYDKIMKKLDATRDYTAEGDLA
jgi:hypothetical protein